MAISKRAMDILLGTLLSILTLPLMLLAALVSAASLRCWPLFVQRRVGKDGRLFQMVKIRTLPRSVPPYASKYDLDDANVPRLARWLRRTHLDELPQLLLVPLGQMSLVGPRPEMEILADEFDRETAALRTSVRPGCTGLWQVSPRSEGLIPEAPEYDRFYLAHQNPRLDLWVLWCTLWVMAAGRAPIPLADVPSWALRKKPVPQMGRATEPRRSSVQRAGAEPPRSFIEVLSEASNSD